MQMDRCTPVHSGLARCALQGDRARQSWLSHNALNLAAKAATLTGTGHRNPCQHRKAAVAGMVYARICSSGTFHCKGVTLHGALLAHASALGTGESRETLCLEPNTTPPGE